MGLEGRSPRFFPYHHVSSLKIKTILNKRSLQHTILKTHNDLGLKRFHDNGKLKKISSFFGLRSWNLQQ